MPSPTSSPQRDLLNYAKFLRDNGFLYLEASADASVAVPVAAPVGSGENVATEATREAAAPPTADAKFEARASLDLGEKEKIAAEMAEAIAACEACELCRSRTQIVFGDGSLDSKILFVGEAPGAEEDRTGIPFVGRAGKLLTKMIEAIGFDRSEVFICNTLKCRPPDNRDPKPSEKEACRHFLEEQIDLIRPQILVGLGAHAASYLTGQQIAIGKMREQWYEFHGVATMVTYHPAFLLRSPSFKRKSWDDFKMLAGKYAELNPGDPRKIWSKDS